MKNTPVRALMLVAAFSYATLTSLVVHAQSSTHSVQLKQTQAGYFPIVLPRPRISIIAQNDQPVSPQTQPSATTPGSQQSSAQAQTPATVQSNQQPPALSPMSGASQQQSSKPATQTQQSGTSPQQSTQPSAQTQQSGASQQQSQQPSDPSQTPGASSQQTQQPVDQSKSQSSGASPQPQQASPQGNNQPQSLNQGNSTQRWAVKVGSFSSDRDIKKTIAVLQNNGFDGFVKEIKKGDSTITEVYVGPTKQRSAAENLYNRLKQAHILGSVVPTEYNEQV